MKRILFQGDSITDWFRGREREDVLGSNYVTMIAGELGYGIRSINPRQKSLIWSIDLIRLF
ncbi:MAG: hypothetical protein SOS24_04565 [Clostridia bacterium]|nr:hypothetical protein [Clostridia bacterium]